MMLGNLIARLDDEAVAREALLATGDIALIARVQAAAETAGLPIGEMLQELVGSFASLATSSHWISVMNAAGRADDPGTACLCIMLGVALGGEETGHGQIPVSA